MKTKRPLLWIIGLLLLTILAAACGGNAEPAEEIEPEVVATEPAPVVSGDEPADTEEAATDLGTYGQPIDVPIFDTNRDLRISRSGENINYIADDVTVQVVYDFYKDQLDELGWLPGPNEVETVAGNLVTLARANEAKDRITVTMQNNPIGEFVVLSIVIVRAP